MGGHLTPALHPVIRTPALALRPQPVAPVRPAGAVVANGGRVVNEG